MNIVDDTDGPLDPRIQVELENLNNATDDINKLEIELDEANTAYGQLLSETTSRLKELVSKLGSSCIERARCYFEACGVAHQARLKCQQQTQLYQRANVVHEAAKETVALAEACFISHQHEWNFDQAWQDVLNHATFKVMEAETQKTECAREHQKATILFHEAEKKVQQLEEKYRRSINKAQPYFDLKAQFDQKLAIQKEVVDCLKKAVKDTKCSYAASLRALEEISNEIHEKRRDYAILANGPREPGVGAELVTPDECFNYEEELNKLKISRVNSIASSDQDLEDRIQDFEDVKNLKERVDHLSVRSVDGSESTSNQWELELQASVEKLNHLPFKTCESDETNCVNNVTVKSTGTVRCMENDVKVIPGENILKDDRNELLIKLENIFQRSQSLTQSPINSIISQSKALRDSFSKSLSNSPVNMGAFSFGKSKSTESQVVPDQSISSIQDPKSTDSNKVNDSISQLEKEPAVKEQQKVSKSINEKNSTSDILAGQKNTQKERKKSDSSLKPIEPPNRSSRSSVDDTHLRNMPKGTHSLDSTPVRAKPLPSSKSTSFISNDSHRKVKSACNDIQPSCSSSKIMELPLLSFFQKSINTTPSRDKSCSMINLNEKQNLKTLLDKSDLGNIQAVSIEKLANARHKLVGEIELIGDLKNLRYTQKCVITYYR
ncbi:SH3 domain-binding protein 5 homolog [Copidosoma floridanum]|uniref:SH3 domain-binding protein 5 homolog n=1 Tax=Copidosoma floridanum TaxID=29053 RepID=UPI0006C9A43F|nr:SH3 domain-binding protein 5 homolog [Copidosoma floridanum]